MNLDKRVVNAIMYLDECDLGAVMYHYLHTEDMDEIHDNRVRCIVLLMRAVNQLSDMQELTEEIADIRLRNLKREIDKNTFGDSED